MCPKHFFRITPFITLYSLSHLVTDASCAFLLLGVLDLNEHLILSLILYNALAFVLQAPIGYLIDKMFNPKLLAIIGLVLIAISFLFWDNIFAALIFAGVGNTLFHVGGGSLVLSLENRKATFSGLFVAPGGVGLALGTFFAASRTNIYFMLFPIVLIILAVVLCFVKTPVLNRTNEGKVTPDYRFLLVFLILIPIVIRSIISLSIEFPWKENQVLYIILVAAIALGKAFGGILIDRFGLIKVGVGGLLVSMPLLAFFTSIPALSILGIFFFNFSMTATLIAIWNILPRYKGLSFGLTTTAIFGGSLPVILGKDLWMKNNLVVFLLIFIAAILLFAALRNMKSHNVTSHASHVTN